MGQWPENKSPVATAEISNANSANANSDIRGFTPIELLMSITLLGIVAATVVPQMLSSSEETRQTALLHRLHLVRRQIENYYASHDGRLPGEGRNSAEAFLLDLKNAADALPEAFSSRTSSGEPTTDQPSTRMPPLNPYTQRSEILVIPDRLQKRHYSGEGNHGWAYSSTTGEFRANLSQETQDRSGRLINQLNVLPRLR